MGDIMKDIFVPALQALTIGLLGTNSALAGSKAEKITTANAAAYVQNGPDATGGIGDWVLTNGTLCIIITGKLENEGDFSSRGGTLRDIGFVGVMMTNLFRSKTYWMAVWQKTRWHN